MSIDEDSEGKYLLLSVPDFATDPLDSSRSMTSFLRLGTAPSQDEDPGYYLLEDIHLAGPPGGHIAGSEGEEPYIYGPEDDERPIFVDDTRHRSADGESSTLTPHELSATDRATQTAALLTRGGWRDHSDGNRITTTYGDKIEVIRGNYKMMVLGRQDDFSAASGWDVSGQHIQDFAYTMPGASIRVEYSQTWDGAWHLQNTTEKVIETANYAGDFYEFRWGNHLESTIGSEDPREYYDATLDADGNITDDRPRQNPHIKEKTWATKIESYTGSSSWRIPSITDETWAKEVSELTDVSGTLTSNTRAGVITEATTAGVITSATTAAMVTSVDTVGQQLDVYVGGLHESVDIAGVHAELIVTGLKYEVLVGKKVIAHPYGDYKEFDAEDAIRVARSDITNAYELAINTAQASITAAYTAEVNALQTTVGGIQVQLGAGVVNPAELAAAVADLQREIADIDPWGGLFG